MTYARREEIFSKEALTNQEIAELFDCSIPKASQIAHEIKRRVGSRIDFEGRVHVQDYLDYMEIKSERMDMYRRPLDEDSKPPVVRRTVCYDVGGQI